MTGLKRADSALEIEGDVVKGCTATLTYRSSHGGKQTVTGEVLRYDSQSLVISDDDKPRHIRVKHGYYSLDVETLADSSAHDGRKIGSALDLSFDGEKRELGKAHIIAQIKDCEAGGTVIVNGTEYGVVSTYTDPHALEFASQEHGVRETGTIRVAQDGVIFLMPGDGEDVELEQVKSGLSHDDVARLEKTDEFFGVPIEGVSEGDRLVFSASLTRKFAERNGYDNTDRTVFAGEVTEIQPYRDNTQSPVHTIVRTDDGDKILLAGTEDSLGLYVNTVPSSRLMDSSGHRVEIESDGDYDERAVRAAECTHNDIQWNDTPEVTVEFTDDAAFAQCLCPGCGERVERSFKAKDTHLADSDLRHEVNVLKSE